MVCSKPIYLQLKFIYFLQANFTVSLVLENRNYFATLSLFFICHKNVTWHEIFLFCGLFLRPFCGPHYFTLYYLHNSEVGCICIVLYVGLPKVWNIRAFSSSTVKSVEIDRERFQGFCHINTPYRAVNDSNLQFCK